MAKDDDGQRWAKELVARVGLAIKAARGKRSAAWLSDRTADLGYRVSPTVIAKLDSGHRGAVLSVPELLILAAALNTSPVNLVYPGPYDIQVELLPGWNLLEYDGAEWFSGVQSHLFSDDQTITNRPDMLEKFQQWQEWERNTETLNQWRELKELIITRNNMDNPDHLATLGRQIKSVEDRLIRLLGRPLDRDAIDPPVELKVADDD